MIQNMVADMDADEQQTIADFVTAFYNRKPRARKKIQR